MKNINIFFIAFLLLILNISFATGTGEWPNYQRFSSSHQGSVSDVTGGLSVTPTNYVTLPAGNFEEQPLYITTNSGNRYFIIKDGNYINSYNSAGVSIDQKLVYPKSPLSSFGNATGYYILFSNSSHSFSYHINDSGNFIYSANSSNGGTSTNSSYNCPGGTLCYFLNNSNAVCEWDATPNPITCYNTDNIATDEGRGIRELVSDSANNRIIWTANYSSASSARNNIYVYNTNTHSLDTSFGTTGKILILAGAGCSNAMKYQLYSGFTNYIVSCGHSTDGTLRMYAYRTDGSNQVGFPATSSSVGVASGLYGSQPAMCNLVDVDREICSVMNLGGGTPKIGIVCFYHNGTQSFIYQVNSLVVNTGLTTALSNVVCADIDNDSYDEVLTTYLWLNRTGSLINNLSSVIGDRNANNYVFNDGTGNLGLISSYSGNTRIYGATSPTTNIIPSLTGNFGKSFSILCNGSTLQISARDCDYFSSCNYQNDNMADTERIVLDVNGNGSLSYGSYSLSNPTIDVTLTIGNYYSKIYLQDSYHDTDISQVESYTIQVIDGLNGVTCNIAVIEPGSVTISTASPVSGTDISAGADIFINQLTGGTTNNKLIIGFILFVSLLVTIIVGMAKLGVTGGTLAVIAGILGIILFIILTIFELFPVWILVLLLIILALLTFLGFAFKSNAGG